MTRKCVRDQEELVFRHWRITAAANVFNSPRPPSPRPRLHLCASALPSLVTPDCLSVTPAH